MSEGNGAALLSVRNLSVSYPGGAAPTVEDVSFDVAPGETLALIGQSGSGKSTIANAVLRLLSHVGARVSGVVGFDGRDLLTMSAKEFRALRGRRLGYVPQDPSHSLNPVRTVGAQLAESLGHRDLLGVRLLGRDARRARAAYREQVVDLLSRVHLPDPVVVAGRYPHELSGGMLQRVLIANAIAGNPSLIVADEPTSALDVTVQQSILELLDSLKNELGVGLLFVTHDLALAAQRSDSVIALEGGRIQEHGPAAELLRTPRSDTARRLLADVPALAPGKYAETRRRRTATHDRRETALEVTGLVKTFGKGASAITAVDGVSFAVPRATTHALVGESGSGKSTIGRIIMRLEQQDSGQVSLGGAAVSATGRRELKQLRRNLQLVYQNPFTSLDPARSIDYLVAEPLVRHRIGTRSERAERARALLDLVGLGAKSAAGLTTGRLSGGQRQRVAIARALALEPRLLILDEPTSALDVSVQTRILDLLAELQERLGLTYLFISHDLGVVRQFADTVSVIRRGTLVEHGTAAEILEAPREEYTRRLVASVPWYAGAPASGNRSSAD
ncbi:ABC transporter ATP-binding protein [Nocardia sp. BMG51109]|uniref:ATP-binding cassette domain-containing protein n=1 Tax=Nocardia sp. BMG51109 TaxID=1056816 RepID=UPI0004650866|nr:ABC transporter ATP-binding protein [Nocardia sp. BMG51109]